MLAEEQKNELLILQNMLGEMSKKINEYDAIFNNLVALENEKDKLVKPEHISLTAFPPQYNDEIRCNEASDNIWIQNLEDNHNELLSNDSFVRKATEIVEQNIENSEFSTLSLVQALGISRTLVHLRLKKATSQSTSEFIKNIRLKKAKQLLDAKQYKISEVCYRVGFTDPKYFSKSFKKLYGRPPAQYIDGKISDKSLVN